MLNELKSAKFFRTHQRLRGAHSVEMAFMLPIVFVLFLGGIEFARLQIIKHLADNASYEAARAVMVPGATVAEAQAIANNVMKIGGIKGATVTVSPNPILETTQSITVNVSIPTSNNLWSAATFSKNLSISANTLLVTERGPASQVSAIASLPPPPVVVPTTTTPTTR